MKAARLEREPSGRQELANAREEERRRLARDLHDGPAQAMAAALFGVDLAIAAIDRNPGGAREELLRSRALLRDALTDLRVLMFGLRPRLLEERGLVVALEALAGATPLWGPSMTIETRGIAAGERLPDEIELGLYRIAQEAVSNARRHSAATAVRLALERVKGRAVLVVADDGHGFVPRRIGPAVGAGEGIPGMRERTETLGGELSIESSPGAGTRVTVSVPLPEIGVWTREGTQ
jgi:two-component system sensor histidine kinase DegS